MTTDELITRYETLTDICREVVQLQNKIIADLQQKLQDATESDRRPKHHGYSFHTYDSADAAFIHSYLNRNREEYSDAQG
jgi:hypothetical protein